MEQTRTHLAYRRAGGVVAAQHLGICVVGVTIRSDGESVGGLWLGVSDDPTIPINPLLDWKHLIIMYAGPAAMDRYEPGRGADGAWGDDEEAAELLALHSDLSEDVLRQKAREIVDAEWKAVCDVADALLEHQTLEGMEISCVVSAHLDGMDWRQSLAKWWQISSDSADELDGLPRRAL